MSTVRREPPQYIETLRPVRASTAARLSANFANVGGTCGVTCRGGSFRREGSGPWLRVVRRGNPAFYALPGYQTLADATGPAVKALVVRYDRHTAWGEVTRQMRALAKREGLAGFVGGWHDCEGTSAAHWKRTKWPRFVWRAGRFVPYRG
jgi:hypothetical protein